VEKLIK